VVRFAEEIVYPIRRPDWQIVQIENYESGEIRLAYTVYVFGRERYVPPPVFFGRSSKCSTYFCKGEKVKKSEAPRLKMKGLAAPVFHE